MKQPPEPIFVRLSPDDQIDAVQLMEMGADEAARAAMRAETIKYSVIVVSSVPMLIIYPFVQKFFVKGVMIGAVKG